MKTQITLKSRQMGDKYKLHELAEFAEREQAKHNSGDIKALAHALIEEHSSNGGHFASPDTELMIRGICDFDESPLDALKRLIGVNNQKKS